MTWNVLECFRMMDDGSIPQNVPMKAPASEGPYSHKRPFPSDVSLGRTNSHPKMRKLLKKVYSVLQQDMNQLRNQSMTIMRDMNLNHHYVMMKMTESRLMMVNMNMTHHSLMIHHQMSNLKRNRRRKRSPCFHMWPQSLKMVFIETPRNTT